MSTLNSSQMRAAVKAGKALPAPGQDRPGRFQILNRTDLENAIRAVGRASGDHNVVRRYIIRRARALNLSNLIPDNWSADGSMKGM